MSAGGPDPLFTALVVEDDPNEPFVQVHWARAPHLGAALERMRADALGSGLRRPICSEADPYDPSNLSPEAAARLVHAGDGRSFWSEDRHAFPPDGAMELPFGVIPSCIEGDEDPSRIRPGFRVRRQDGLTFVEANVDAADLLPHFGALLRTYGRFRAFWYVLHEDWDDAPSSERFATEALQTPDTVIDHVQANADDGLRNGFVTLCAYVEAGATNVTISDHKQLVVSTRSEFEAARAARALERAGLERLDPFVTVTAGIYHWHFRPVASRSRVELAAWLAANGFARL